MNAFRLNFATSHQKQDLGIFIIQAQGVQDPVKPADRAGLAHNTIGAMRKHGDVLISESAIIIVTQRSSYQLTKNIVAVPIQAALMNKEADSSKYSVHNTTSPHTMVVWLQITSIN